MALQKFFCTIKLNLSALWWFSAPIVVSAGVFLVLHNNTCQGLASSLGIAALNIILSVCPAVGPRRAQAGTAIRLGAICAAASLASMVALERVFPMLFPAEHAAIRELAKSPGCALPGDGAWYRVVFTNGEQKIWAPASAEAAARVEHLHWHVPGKEFEYYGYDPNDKYGYVNVVRWNGEGYYDHDYERPKPAGVHRIVVIGDSYVESAQVPLARTFHKLLAHKINNRFGAIGGGRDRVEIVALGHSGTGQAHNLEILSQEAWAYEPDAVVFTLCHNDFCDDDADLRRERSIALGEITPEIRSLARHGFYVPALAFKRYQEFRMRTVSMSPELLQWRTETLPRVEAAWEKTLECVQAAASQCSARGIPFRLVCLGSEVELNYTLNPRETVSRLPNMRVNGSGGTWDMTRSLKRIQDFCNSRGISCISLLPSLAQAQKTTGKKVFGDHYSMFGHEVVADALSLHLDPGVRPVLAQTGEK